MKVDLTRDVVIRSQESWTQKISNKWRLTALEMWWYGAKRVGHRRSATSEGWPHSRCGDMLGDDSAWVQEVIGKDSCGIEGFGIGQDNLEKDHAQVTRDRLGPDGQWWSELTMTGLNKTGKNKDITIKTECRIINGLDCQVVLYRNESWTIIKADKKNRQLWVEGLEEITNEKSSCGSKVQKVPETRQEKNITEGLVNKT